MNGYMAPGISDFKTADIPDISKSYDQSHYWLTNYILNSILRGDYGLPFKSYAFNFLRKAEGAFREHELARVATLRYLTSGKQSPSSYMEALLYWEHFLALSWQAYDLFRRAFGIRIFTPGDRSLEERLNLLYNSCKHDVGSVSVPPEAIIPVWMTDNGLTNSKVTVTFPETADVLQELAKWAAILEDPLTVQDKLKLEADRRQS